MTTVWPGPEDSIAYFVPRPERPAAPGPPRSLEEEVIGHRQFFGLAADPESVRRAIENEARPGYDFPGMWFTPEEELEEKTFDRELFDRMEAFAIEHGAELGVRAHRWLNGKRALEIPIKGDVEYYRELLTAQFGTDRLIVKEASYSRQELEDLAERVSEDCDDLAQLGIDVAVIHRSILDREEGVHVSYWATDEARAAAAMRERYGDMVVLDWLGPGNPTEQPKAFGSYITDGTTLTVFYAHTRDVEEPASCTVQEHEDRVIVTLTVLVHATYVQITRGVLRTHASVQLSRPLGNRTVIDAADNVPRPEWTGTSGRK
jgi:hypothetical protein